MHAIQLSTTRILRSDPRQLQPRCRVLARLATQNHHQNKNYHNDRELQYHHQQHAAKPLTGVVTQRSSPLYTSTNTTKTISPTKQFDAMRNLHPFFLYSGKNINYNYNRINIYSTQCATITSCASTRNSSSNRRYTTSDSSFTPLSANNSKVPTIVAPYWRVFEFRETDKRFEATEIARAEIQRTFRIVNRDLRLFITSWKSQSVILARKKCILVNLPDQSIQAIITSDRMILFNSDDPKVQRLADSIEHDFRSNEYNDTHNPFEFQVLEALLTRACEECDAEYRKISKPIRDLLVDTDLGISDEKLYALLELKNQLDNFQTSVSEIHDAIETVLQSDEDMAEMYLTVKAQFGHRRMIDQHEEIEMLLETYSKQFEDILHRITDLKSSIQSTQDFLTINLDSTRNTMLKLELKLTMASTAMTAGTLIAGILGMNLINHLETHPFAFHFFASFAVLFSMFFYMATTRYAKLAGIFKPRAPLSRRIAELKRTNQIHFESDFDITLTQRSGKNRE